MALEARAQAIERRIDDLDAAHRLAGAAFALAVQAYGVLAGVEHPGVVDLVEIVILGGQPEDGHGAHATVAQLAGELGGGERLVDRIGRTGEEAHLLAGDDGHGVRQLQLRQRGGLTVGFAQRCRQKLAPLVR